MGRLEGRVALVRGARGGIGRTTADRLARARVCLTGVDAAILHFSSEEASFVRGEFFYVAGGPRA